MIPVLLTGGEVHHPTLLTLALILTLKSLGGELLHQSWPSAVDATNTYGLLIRVSGVGGDFSQTGVSKYYIGPIGDLSLSTATVAG